MELDTKRNMGKKDLYQWTEIFKGLGNTYRLQIVRLLDKKGKLTVSAIKAELDISFKNTSRNLGILRNLDILKSQGKSDHVFYEINPSLEKEIKQIIKQFI